MFCQNCSAVETEGARFCRDCGESLIEDSGFHHFGVRRNGWLIRKVHSLKAPLDCLFQRSLSKKIGFVYFLSAFIAGSIAFASIVIGFHTSPWFGLLTLLVGAPLTFFFLLAFSRPLLDFFTVRPRIVDQLEKPVTPTEPRDEIEWNIQ